MPTVAQQIPVNGESESGRPVRKIQLALDEDVYLRLKLVAAKSGVVLGRVASDALRVSLPVVSVEAL
jgi:hypothetical protein